MRDLAILVPSRGRPGNVRRLVSACERLCTSDYQLCFAFDDDDPSLAENKRNAGGSYIFTGPRQGLAAWTNDMWRELAGEFAYYASIGDDHEPITPQWDSQMMMALETHGGGFAYCNNGHPDPNWPEMCIVSAPILDALGYFAEPSMLHYCIDVVWRDLGNAADCLYYLPDVTLVHHNWALYPGRRELRDSTYWDNQLRGREDVHAHEVWEATRKADDVEKVKAALKRPGEGTKSDGDQRDVLPEVTGGDA